MRFNTKLVRNLTPEEYRACSRLNMGSEGTMHATLRDAREGYYPGARTLMVWKENSLMGWALVFSDCGEKIVHVYVRSSCRRRGIGARLLREALKWYPDVRCCPWDQRSRDFYELYRLKPGAGYHFDPLTGLAS